MKFLGHDIASPSYTPMTAWLRHGPFAMWLVKAARPKSIVELGSHFGYSYFSFCQAVLEEGLQTDCVAVDTWEGDEHAGHYGEEVYQEVIRQNNPYRSFSKLLRKSFAEALVDVPDGSVELLHVDGRHRYEDVRDDFESWIPKLAKNAIVLFHDTMVRERGFGVWKYWAELSGREETFNFTFQHGLGVLFRGQDLTPEMACFRDLTRTDAGRQAVAAVFSGAGELQARDYTFSEVSRIALTGEQALREFLRSLETKSLRCDESLVRLSPGSETITWALLESFETTRRISNDMTKLQGSVEANFLENLELRRQIAYARSRAHRVWKDYLLHKLLSFLINCRNLPVGENVRTRWAKSASKRDPQRSLVNAPMISVKIGESIGIGEVPMPLADRGKVIRGALAHESEKPSILIVSHEASRTGAPILAQNLARELSERYNVTILCVRGAADLVPEMLQVSTGVLLLQGEPQPRDKTWRQVTNFLAASDFMFAIVNSAESRSVLPILKLARVPVVALMHEFASNTLPKTAFTEVMSTADYTVFSTALTLESACETTGLSPTPNVRVIPQGKCDIPSVRGKSAAREAERAKLKSLIRPSGSEDDFIVLGAGTIQIRKGVDLFIEVARTVSADLRGRKIRFVWIGQGYDPEKDSAYSIYLQDQIRRSGLEDRVMVLPSTQEIEYAYELADAFVLSSRLDPLPNVGIDAMKIGLPVLCFNRASGFAEILFEGGMGDECVAEYLSPADLARRLVALLEAPEHYLVVSRRMKEIAAEVFDMRRYASQIEELALNTVARRDNLGADIKTISEAERFDPNFMGPVGSVFNDRKQAARVYLENFAMGPYGRRPEAGFNPHRYAAFLLQQGVLESSHDPYAHFLRAGRPEGPWITKVLDTTNPIQVTSGMDVKLRCALHIHAFYVTELPRLLNHLKANATLPALFISVTDEASERRAERYLKEYDGSWEVRVVPNVGRDIGPFLTEFGRTLVEGFDVIGHVHTKRSTSISSQAVVENWTRLLFENVLGGKMGGAMVDRILQAFCNDSKLGLIYPSDPNLLGWAKNWQYAQELAKKLHLGVLPDAFDFPVGTMFWIRSEALCPFVDLELEWSSYPREPIGTDATMLHALERLFGIVPTHKGFNTAVTSIRGVKR